MTTEAMARRSPTDDDFVGWGCDEGTYTYRGVPLSQAQDLLHNDLSGWGAKAINALQALFAGLHERQEDLGLIAHLHVSAVVYKLSPDGSPPTEAFKGSVCVGGRAGERASAGAWGMADPACAPTPTPRAGTSATATPRGSSASRAAWRAAKRPPGRWPPRGQPR